MPQHPVWEIIAAVGAALGIKARKKSFRVKHFEDERDPRDDIRSLFRSADVESKLMDEHASSILVAVSHNIRGSNLCANIYL